MDSFSSESKRKHFDKFKRPAVTNNNCPNRKGDICLKLHKPCSNKSMFYTECPILKGNKKLDMF